MANKGIRAVTGTGRSDRGVSWVRRGSRRRGRRELDKWGDHSRRRRNVSSLQALALSRCFLERFCNLPYPTRVQA